MIFLRILGLTARCYLQPLHPQLVSAAGPPLGFTLGWRMLRWNGSFLLNFGVGWLTKPMLRWNGSFLRWNGLLFYY